MFQLVTGVDWLKYDFEQVQMVANATEAYSTIDNIGAFLLVKIRPYGDERLVVSAGLRYDDFDVHVRSHTSVTGNYNRDVTTSLNKFNPSVGVTYSPADFIKLRASYGSAYKLPLPRQMGGYTYMMTTPFVGNPDLKPEESRNLEFGFDIEYRGLFFTATFFDTKMKNMIDYRTIVRGTPEWIPGITANNYYWYYNVDKSTIRGIDVGVSFDIGEYLDLPFRIEPYLYWTRLFKFHNDDTGDPISDRGRDTASFGIDFSYPEIKLSASLDGVRYGKMISGSGSSAAPIAASYVWGFTIKKTLFGTDSYGDVNIKASVRNLFNESYQTTVDEYMPGRSFYVAIEYKF
jgi:vitamin B12 transporter